MLLTAAQYVKRYREGLQPYAWPSNPATCRIGARSVIDSGVAFGRLAPEFVDEHFEFIDWEGLAGSDPGEHYQRIVEFTMERLRVLKPLSVRDFGPVGEFAKKIALDFSDCDQAAELLINVASLMQTRHAIEPSERTIFLQAGRWAQCGFPVVKLTRAQATNFMLSDPPDDELDDLKTPWRSFMIQLEPGTLTIETNLADPSMTAASAVDVRSVGVVKMKSRSSRPIAPDRRVLNDLWTIRLDVGFGHLWQTSRTARELTNLDAQSNAWTMKVADNELKVIGLAAKMVLNTVLAASGGDARRVERKKRKDKKPRRDPRLIARDTPITDYVLGTVVKIDATQYVNEYLRSGKGSPRKVQWWVRGFWKNQPHGPGRTLRKRVFVEGHPAGRKSGPMLVRDYEIKE